MTIYVIQYDDKYYGLDLVRYSYGYFSSEEEAQSKADQLNKEIDDRHYQYIDGIEKEYHKELDDYLSVKAANELVRAQGFDVEDVEKPVKPHQLSYSYTPSMDYSVLPIEEA